MATMGDMTQQVATAPTKSKVTWETMSWKERIRAIVTLILLIWLLVMAFGYASSKPKATGIIAEGQKLEEGSSLACGHFRDIAGDIGNGILTPAEMRSKFKEVYNDSSIGTGPVQTGSLHLLAAGTTFSQLPTDANGQNVITAAEELSSACSAVGY